MDWVPGRTWGWLGPSGSLCNELSSLLPLGLLLSPLGLLQPRSDPTVRSGYCLKIIRYQSYTECVTVTLQESFVMYCVLLLLICPV
jgi:hypothetical protein